MWLTSTTMVGTVDGDVYNTTKTTRTSHSSTIQPSDFYTLLSSGLNKLLSVLSSTGVVCTYWCAVMNEPTTQQQPAISSAPPSPFPTLPIYHV
ncbi:unnamed protein product [Rotaria magnacalcarata]|uniref:Uncharacterized protein n=2 Tax=Rotaria magnacalcarata TaxID=392030 RepID=A0A816HIA4_9BILA|nr:unnamed protein product [Rotaria magnacalcarata]CAF1686889.1 unnamed protein product [Rotaria magnacalcarata]CAF2034349.1 unnamed protein product [Rotaria magnacalcarata]CAF2129875.1 unnamed protein product [Rotaria magnacalcarata]CAF2141746.1 unnamed protein product [Rotaria magnacalcarata]